MAGPCKHNGSACPIGCSAFKLSPTLIPGVLPATKVVIAGGPLKVEMIDFKLEVAKSEPVDIKAQRKKDGVCVECGDRGTFVNLQCICNNGHGKIF